MDERTWHETVRSMGMIVWAIRPLHVRLMPKEAQLTWLHNTLMDMCRKKD